MAALFGQIGHGTLKPTDWGWKSFNGFRDGMKRDGFAVVETFPEGTGVRLAKRYGEKLEVTIDAWSPEALRESRPRAEVEALIKEALAGHELFYYDGHSFYGGLTALDDPAAYPARVYQVIFMNSCWSYAYYTKQVFAAKVDETDPDGTRWADVVNNTEPSLSGGYRTSVNLFKTLFKGAATLAGGGTPTAYSWNNLIQYMNRDAEERVRYTDLDPEVYGVSGVRDNCYRPTGNSPCTADE